MWDKKSGDREEEREISAIQPSINPIKKKKDKKEKREKVE